MALDRVRRQQDGDANLAYISLGHNLPVDRSFYVCVRITL